MKRLRVLSLVWVLATVISGCARPVAMTSEESTSRLKLALILPSGKDDLSWSQSMAEGVQAIQQARGIQVSIRENVQSTEADRLMREYAAQKYDIIIVHGIQFQSALLDLAKEFPDTTFAYGSGTQTASNVYAYDLQAQMGGYVLGLIAARMTRSQIIGIVGPEPAGDAAKFNLGFKAGIVAQDPNIKILESYTGAFDDAAKAQVIAQEHLDGGADFLTGTAQQAASAIQTVARKPGVYWLGNEMDQSRLAPETVLVSQVYQWQGIIETIVDNRAKGIKGGQRLTLDLASGRLKLVYNPQLADKIPAGVKSKAEDAQKAIADGRLIVPQPPR